MFSLPSLFVFPEGGFVFDSEFNAAVAEASTSDAAFIVAELSKKLAHTSRTLMQKAKADADLRVASATERLGLADKLRRAEAEILALKDENQQLRAKCSKLESTASDNKKVLESLRRTVEGDANEKAALKGRITELERVQAKITSRGGSPQGPEGSFWRLLSTGESSFRISPPLVGFRAFPSGGNLLLSEAMLVRVILEKKRLPLPNESLPGGIL